MADKVVPMDVRSMVVTWPDDAPRGAVTRFVAEHGVSRSWFYELRARTLVEGALAAMQPRPREPRTTRHRQAIPVEVEDLAVRIRKELADQGWDHGPVTVRHRLSELGVASPAASTLARIFVRRGMVMPQPQKRPRSSYRRFQFGMVHECWQLDGYEWRLRDDTLCTIYQLLDDCSRYLICSYCAVGGERSTEAITVVRRGIERFQVPRLLLSDNGTAFNQDRRGHTSQLVALLTQLGCRPITGTPRHPQTQGKDERVHATQQQWLRAQPAPHTVLELQALLAGFDEYYNHRRPHQALGMRTPAQALTAGPVAVSPLPPDPTPTQASPVTAEPRRVSAGGKITVNYAHIQLGHQHAGTTVSAVISKHTVTVFDSRGALIRTVVLVPGQRYHGNGKPRGFHKPNPTVHTDPRHPNRPDQPET